MGCWLKFRKVLHICFSFALNRMSGRKFFSRPEGKEKYSLRDGLAIYVRLLGMLACGNEI